MRLFSTRQSVLVEKERALPGRVEAMAPSAPHLVLGTPVVAPFPDGFEQAIFGLGCSWGAEQTFWETPGVYTTAVGYAGGFTPNPTYREVCSGRTGHTESVLVVFDPTVISYEALLAVFFASHNPTQGMRQGYDRGSQYRSVIYTTSPQQAVEAATAAAQFRQTLKGTMTTEIAPAGPFYYAEPYHQQYFAVRSAGSCVSATDSENAD